MADDLSQEVKNVQTAKRDYTTISVQVVANFPAAGDRVKLFEIPDNCRFVHGMLRVDVPDSGTSLGAALVAETVAGDIELTSWVHVTDIWATSQSLSTNFGLIMQPFFTRDTTSIFLKQKTFHTDPVGDGKVWCMLGLIRGDYDNKAK